MTVVSLRPRGSIKLEVGKFQAAKEGWLKAIARDPRLSGADLAVAIVIATYLNTRTGDAWPSIITLAADTNRNKGTVWRASQRLEKFEYLHITRARGRVKSNRYRPLLGNFDDAPKRLRVRSQ
jgi:helix-turn-helix protein